jgi:iron complex outermembrane receptor protein
MPLRNTQPLHPCRHRRLPSRAAATVCACLAVAGHAQSASEADKPQQVESIVVTVTRQAEERFALPASVDIVSRTDLQSGQMQVNLSEALARVPGLVIQNRQNYAQDLQISSRGFGARATFGVRGIRLIADDIPATMPDGQGQGATIDLSSAQRIEVLRGPLAVTYGNSSGGVIQAFSEDGPAEPTLGASFFAGSDATRKFGMKGGGTSGAVNYLVDVSRFETDGYRDHSAATRDQLNAKVRIDLEGGGRLALIGNVLRQPESQDPLGLTRAQYEQNPRQADASATIFNTRKTVDNTQGGVVFEQPFSASQSVKLVGYFGTRAITQFQAITVGAQVPPSSPGGVVDLDREFSGVDARYTWKQGWGSVVLGIDYDRSAERRKGYNNFLGTSLGVMGALRRDEDDKVTSFDQYLQVDWRATEKLRVIAGLRASEIKFDSRDYYIVPGNGDDSGAKDFHNVNPAIGVLLEATAALNLYANAGRGFETPTFAEMAYKPTGGSGINFALEAATSNNLEVGAKWRINDQVRATLAGFDITTENEITPATSSGGRSTFQNAGRTTRRGMEFGADAKLPADISVAMALSWLDAKFDQPFSYSSTVQGVTSVRTVAAGNALPGVAKKNAYVELGWRKGLSGFSAAAEARYSDSVFVNDINTEAAPAYTVVNVRLMHEHRVGALQVSEFIRVDNIADRKYAGSVIVNEGNNRFYEPAPGRSAFAGISARYTF